MIYVYALIFRKTKESTVHESEHRMSNLLLLQKIKMTNDTGFLIFHINCYEWNLFSPFRSVCQVMIRDPKHKNGGEGGGGWNGIWTSVFFPPLSIPNVMGNMSHSSLSPLIKQSNRKQVAETF